MTISSLLKQTTDISALDAELLLAHVLRKPREFFISHADASIPLFKKRQFFRLMKKRKRGTPVAYLIGHKEFYGLDFFVTKDTLVPRPDTELMVELASKCISNKTLLIDVGTGTGCIPISVTKTQARNDMKTIAIDVSAKALKVARKNAEKHEVDITFHHGNLLSHILHSDIFNHHSHILITANLPYLTQEEIDSEASIQQEPHLALYADDQGLALYKELLKQVKTMLEKDPDKRISVLMEISPWQSELLQTHCRLVFPDATIQAHNDLCKRERVVALEINDKMTS